MKVHHYSRALSWITRPRVTETATLETFTPELDRMEFNPGGRVGFKHGGSWAGWMSNHSEQMTFEEYLQMDMDKPVHPVDKSTGGRVEMKPGGLVEPGVTHYGKKEPWEHYSKYVTHKGTKYPLITKKGHPHEGEILYRSRTKGTEY